MKRYFVLAALLLFACSAWADVATFAPVSAHLYFQRFGEVNITGFNTSGDVVTLSDFSFAPDNPALVQSYQFLLGTGGACGTDNPPTFPDGCTLSLSADFFYAAGLLPRTQISGTIALDVLNASGSTVLQHVSQRWSVLTPEPPSSALLAFGIMGLLLLPAYRIAR